MNDCESGIKITTVPYCVSSVGPRGTFDGVNKISCGLVASIALYPIPLSRSQSLFSKWSIQTYAGYLEYGGSISWWINDIRQLSSNCPSMSDDEASCECLKSAVAQKVPEIVVSLRIIIIMACITSIQWGHLLSQFDSFEDWETRTWLVKIVYIKM